jgi:hypothetical protein
VSKHAGGDPAANLRRRIEQAQAEHRWKDAIDLARQLVKVAATEEHHILLRYVALGFARSLAEKGRTRDLTAELPRLAGLFPGNTAWVSAIAEVAVQAGLIAEGLRLLPAGVEVEQAAKMRALAADSSIRLEAVGRKSLPADLQADHDRILQAFTLVEQGKDEEARTVLQGVGLRSPFAEWRLFLRGLQAYYGNDDARAIESWARLAADRMPFRLAAPYRARIDPTFRDAQPPQTQHALHHQFESLSEKDSLTSALKALFQGIAQQRSLAQEFAALHQRQAELKALPPEVFDRLARSIYWALLPAPDEEHLRFKRIFLVPREDPKFLRLRALCEEREGAVYDAIATWQRYEQEIASDASLWGEDSARVRALLWVHMGRLASIPTEDLVTEEDFDFGGPFGRPRRRESAPPPQPPVDFAACYEKARELAPDLVDAYIQPAEDLRAREEYAKARPLAMDLRQRFPDSVDAQMTAAMIFSDLDEIPEALACTEQAARINPLDQRIQAIRRGYLMALVTYHLRAGRFPQAREAVAAARILCVAPAEQDLLSIQEATIAWKEGDAEAVPKLRAELSTRLNPAHLLFALVVQANAARIDRKSKAPLDKEFNDLLAGEMPLDEAMTLGRLILAQDQLGSAPYHGYKSHRTKIVKQLAGFATRKGLTVRQYLDLALLTRDLGMKGPFRKLAAYDRKGVPKAVMLFLQALKWIDQGRLPLFGGPPWELFQAEQNLKYIRDENDRAYLRDLIERTKQEHDFGEFRDPFEFLDLGDPFGDPFGGPDEDDLDDEDFP